MTGKTSKGGAGQKWPVIFMELEVIDNTRVFILPMYIDFPVSESAIAKRIIKENKKRASKILKAGQKRQPPLTKMRPFDRYWLNLNEYRNWHPHVEQKIKKTYCPIELPKYFTANKIRISYDIRRQENIIYDEWNPLSIIDKYFCDWLQTCGYIPNDNLKHVTHGQTVNASCGDLESKCIARVEILEEIKESDPTQGILF